MRRRVLLVRTIRTRQRDEHRPRGGGDSAMRRLGSLASLYGQASIIAGSLLQTGGRISVRSTELSIPAVFPRILFTTTRFGGLPSRCCIYFLTGIGPGWRERRLPFGFTPTWTRSSCW